MPITPKRQTGNAGEDRACIWLANKGYEIVARNISCAYGEIDIIAKRQQIWHFVEVKTRQTASFGEGVDAVDSRKLPKLIKSAQWYMANIVKDEDSFQIDVISIDTDRISLFENVTFG